MTEEPNSHKQSAESTRKLMARKVPVVALERQIIAISSKNISGTKRLQRRHPNVRRGAPVPTAPPSPQHYCRLVAQHDIMRSFWVTRRELRRTKWHRAYGERKLHIISSCANKRPPLHGRGSVWGRGAPGGVTERESRHVTPEPWRWRRGDWTTAAVATLMTSAAFTKM